MFEIGNYAKVPASTNETWTGIGQVVKVWDVNPGEDPCVSLIMSTGKMTGIRGAFKVSNLFKIAKVESSAPVFVKGQSATFPEQAKASVDSASEGIQKAVSAHSKVFSIARDLAIQHGKTNRYVNIEHVQDGLIKLGYKPSDLGNAAGGIFRSKLWKDTGKTVKSSRKDSRARKITVWRYVG